MFDKIFRAINKLTLINEFPQSYDDLKYVLKLFVDNPKFMNGAFFGVIKNKIPNDSKRSNRVKTAYRLYKFFISVKFNRKSLDNFSKELQEIKSFYRESE